MISTVYRECGVARAPHCGAADNESCGIRVRLPVRRIVEARRKLNRWPSQTERAIIARWAAQERLVIGDEAYR